MLVLLIVSFSQPKFGFPSVLDHVTFLVKKLSSRHRFHIRTCRPTGAQHIPTYKTQTLPTGNIPQHAGDFSQKIPVFVC